MINLPMKCQEHEHTEKGYEPGCMYCDMAAWYEQGYKTGIERAVEFLTRYPVTEDILVNWKILCSQMQDLITEPEKNKEILKGVQAARTYMYILQYLKKEIKENPEVDKKELAEEVFNREIENLYSYLEDKNKPFIQEINDDYMTVVYPGIVIYSVWFNTL